MFQAMPRSPQALFGFNAQGCPAKIEFTDFYQPGLELFQIHLVFFDFGVIEAAGLGLFCDFSFEVRTLGDELPVLLVAIGLKRATTFSCRDRSSATVSKITDSPSISATSF
jgi:hypothetical protein